MTDTIRSLIRTWVPLAIGAVVAYLATLGIDLDAETQAGLIVALTGVLQAVYYTVARAIEPHLPAWLTRVLLGSARTPSYDGGYPMVEFSTGERARLGSGEVVTVRAIDTGPGVDRASYVVERADGTSHLAFESDLARIRPATSIAEQAPALNE